MNVGIASRFPRRHIYAFRKQMSIWHSGLRVEDIIISRCGKGGEKYSHKQAYARGALCGPLRNACSTVVNGSLSQCPLKSLVTMACAGRSAALSSSARASWRVGLCGCLRKIRSEKWSCCSGETHPDARNLPRQINN